MGFITRSLCQILLVQGALQCYQARLELSDQAFGEIDNAYHELNDATDIRNADLFRSAVAEENGESENDDYETKKEYSGNITERKKDAIIKDAKDIPVRTKSNESVGEDEEESSVNHEDSKEKRRDGQHRKANSGARRISKQQRMRAKHHHRTKLHRKETDSLESHAEEESHDSDGETAHFYFSKASDLKNISAALGPGPVPIPIVDPTTQTSLSQRPSTEKISTKGPTHHSTFSDSSTSFDRSEIKHVANITSEDIDLVSVVHGHRRGNRRRFKSQNYVSKNSDELTGQKEVVLKPLYHKDGRMFHKHSSKLHGDDHANINQRAGHRKRKHGKIQKEVINTKKNIEKFRLNDEEQRMNLSAIKKGVESSAVEPVTSKATGDNPPDDEEADEEELGEIATDVIDKKSKEESDYILNGRSVESQASLKDENGDTEKKIDEGSRDNRRKGIKSKIEHGDWVNQVTLFPITDYSIKKKKKLTLLGSLKKTLTEFAENDQNKINKNKEKDTIEGNNKGAGSQDKTKSNFQSGSDFYEGPNEYESDVALESDGETEIKRNERDAEERDVKRNPKLPKGKRFFNRHNDPDYEKDDELYDVDSKHDKKSYSSFKKNDENAYGNHGISEKDEYNYDYDSNLSGGGNANSDVSICPANKTTQATMSTCTSTTETICSSKPTRTPTQPDSSIKSEFLGNYGSQTNGSNDPYEMFLNGQLADKFVDEVLRKVRISKKISRELGYENETDETCDRCIELKPIKLPERDVMRNTLGKCPRSRTTAKNYSVCYRVPPPMAKFLDVLVFYEKENENCFYNKIQDDSTFIFTGDYPESMSKGENSVKYKDKLPLESSFNKEAFNRPRLKEDLNEEKNDDKIENSDSYDKQKEKSEDYSSEEDSAGEDVGKARESQSKVKKYTRRYSKSKIDRNKEESFSGIDGNVKENDFSNGFSSSESDPLIKDHSLNKELVSGYNNHRGFGRFWKNAGETINDYARGKINSLQASEVKPVRNFDRYYGKSNHDYLKPYPAKNAPIDPFLGYKSNYGDSSKNNLPKDGRDHKTFYKIPESIRANKADHTNLKNRPSYFGFEAKNHEQDHKTNLNERYNSYNSKIDGLYNYNGEYSLYPNLDGRALEDDLAKTSDGDSDSARMVKRYADNQAAYDDEPNVFFEIPNIEYDLY